MLVLRLVIEAERFLLANIYRQPVGVMISWFTTMVLRERSSRKLRQIRSLFFGTRQMLRQADKPSSIKLAGFCTDVFEQLKTHGVTIDSALMFEDQYQWRGSFMYLPEERCVISDLTSREKLPTLSLAHCRYTNLLLQLPVLRRVRVVPRQA